LSPRPAPLALSGAHVVVTGASRGIGAALAREMAARGATVTVVARSEVPLKALATDIGGQAVQADLADGADLDGLVARIEAGAGPVDVLVNNAAVAVVNRLVDQSPDDIRQSFALNCVAPAELCRQVLPGMLARGRGRIVCVSSLSGLTAFPTLTTYGATKAGLTHFTAALQRELRRTPGVRATIVQLGEVSGTELMEQARRSPTIAAVSARLNRVRALPMLTPEQVAAQIAAAAAAGARHLVTPKRVTPVHLIRELPSRLNDGLLAGID
jgi:short-subunit dehydrogenase